MQGCQYWMRVQSETCDGRPLPAYKVAQVPKKLMSGGGGGGGGGGTPTLFFQPQSFCLRTSLISDKQKTKN